MRVPVELITGSDVKRFTEAVQTVDCDVRLVGKDENGTGSLVYGWVNEQIPKRQTPSELQAGDTTELDSFLAGFSTK